jgi:hypothetical protein
MASIGKILLGTGIGAGVIYVIANLMGKKKLGDKLDTRTLAAIHSLDLKGLVIRVEVVLSNPTEYSLKIKHPYIRLLIETKQADGKAGPPKLIGASTIRNEVIEIKPYISEKLKEPIYITIPLTGLLSLGGSFYQTLVKKQPVTLTVHTLSSIDTGVKWLGYEKKDPITLKPKTSAVATKPKVTPTKPKNNASSTR